MNLMGLGVLKGFRCGTLMGFFMVFLGDFNGNLEFNGN